MGLRWLVLIVVFLALRLFGMDVRWAGAIAFVVFSSIGRTRKRRKPLAIAALPVVDSPITGPSENNPPKDVGQFCDDLMQVLSIVKRALHEFSAPTKPGSTTDSDGLTHSETLFDFAFSTVWPRVKDVQAQLSYTNRNDSAAIQELTRFYSELPLDSAISAWSNVYGYEHPLLGALRVGMSEHSRPGRKILLLPDRHTPSRVDIVAISNGSSLNISSRPSRRRQICIGAALLAFALAVAATIKMSQEKFNHPAESTLASDPALGIGPVWRASECIDENFPQMRSDPLVRFMSQETLGQMRLQSVAMFCSHLWDDAFFSKAARLLEHEDLLFTQLNMARFDGQVRTLLGNLYAPFPSAISNFFKVIDVAPILIADQKTVLKLLKSPKQWEAVARVRRDIGLSDLCTKPIPIPREYVVSEINPRVTLITDIGVDLTLNQALRSITANVFSPRLELARSSIAYLGGDAKGSGAEGTITPELLIMMLRMQLQLGMQQRRTLLAPLELPDLRIFLFLEPKKSLGIEIPYGRVASFDPSRSVILATRSSIGDALQPTQTALTKMLLSLLSAPLIHEFSHYLFFRNSVAQVPFILEGEATANGEEMTRGIRLSMSLPRSHALKKQFIEVTSLFEAGRGKDASGALLMYLAKVETAVRASRFTDVQCDLLGTLLEHPDEERLPIEAQLTLTPYVFNSQSAKYLQYSYAIAWLVYDLDAVRKEGWHTKLEAIALKMRSYQSLSDGEHQTLDQIGKELKVWLKNIPKPLLQLCQESPRGKMAGIGK